MTRKRRLSVEGLVSGTCLVEVLERLHEVDGVDEVGITLNRDGGSPVVVHCAPWVPLEELHRAVAGAGYFRIHPSGRGRAGGWPDDTDFAADHLARGGVR